MDKTHKIVAMRQLIDVMKELEDINEILESHHKYNNTYIELLENLLKQSNINITTIMKNLT